MLAANPPPVVPNSISQPPAAPVRRRWTAIVVVLVVVVITALAVVGTSYLFSQAPQIPPSKAPVNVAPHVVEFLGNGTSYFDFPYTILYTAPALGVKGFSTAANITYASFRGGPAAHLSLSWHPVNGPPLPVVFSFMPANRSSFADVFVRSANGGLQFDPAGECSSPCIREANTLTATNPGSMGVVALKLAMAYQVTRMASTVNSTNASWIQVNYTLRTLSVNLGIQAPFANGTAPTAADLLVAGAPVYLNYSKGYTWSYDQDVHAFDLSAQRFVNSLPAISISTSKVAFNATLTSAFDWDSTSDNHLQLSGSGPVTLQFYVDKRFGTLFVEYVP